MKPDDQGPRRTNRRTLRRNFPDVKGALLEYCVYHSIGEFVHQTPTLFWSHVGEQDYAVLTRKSEKGESILDRVAAIVKRSPPPVENEILVGFAEGHMLLYPPDKGVYADVLS